MIFYPQQTNSYAAMVLKYTITGMFCSTALAFNIDLQTDVISGIKLNVIFVVSLFNGNKHLWKENVLTILLFSHEG